MRNFPANLFTMCTSLWCNRELIKISIKREVVGRYRGSLMGLLWSFFNPIFMLVIYTFVFSVVFKARWHGGSELKIEFALVLFAGLIVFNFFSECINRAPGLIISNVNYVKKVVYPLEVLPWVMLGASLFHVGISLAVWFLAYIVFLGVPHSSILYFPLIICPLALFIMGLSWILASLGVYLRDMAQLINIIVTVLLFMSPIFYPVSALPEHYRFFLYLNPLTSVIGQVRDVLYWGVVPSFIEIIISWMVGVLVAWIGFYCFQKTRRGFADVL